MRRRWCRPLLSWARSMAFACRSACRSSGQYYTPVCWPLRWRQRSRSALPMRKRKSGSRLPLRRRETRALPPIHVSHRLWSETRVCLKRLWWWIPDLALKTSSRPTMSLWKTGMHSPPPSHPLPRSAQNTSPHISLGHPPLTLPLAFRAPGSPR